MANIVHSMSVLFGNALSVGYLYTVYVLYLCVCVFLCLCVWVCTMLCIRLCVIVCDCLVCLHIFMMIIEIDCMYSSVDIAIIVCCFVCVFEKLCVFVLEWINSQLTFDVYFHYTVNYTISFLLFCQHN